MKPRNLAVNIILILMCLTHLVLDIVSLPSWQLGLSIAGLAIAGIVLVIPGFFLKPKHRIVYLVFKSLAIVAYIALMIVSGILGWILLLIYGLSEGLASSCGGTVNFDELDKFVAQYLFIMLFIYFAKIIMLIVDLCVYKKDRKKIVSQNTCDEITIAQENDE